MVANVDKPTFEDHALQREIMRLRQVDNHTNLVYLALEYLSLAVVIGRPSCSRNTAQSWGSPGTGTCPFSRWRSS